MPAKLRLSRAENDAIKKLSRVKWVSAFDSDIGLPMLNKLVADGVLERKEVGTVFESALTKVKFKIAGKPISKSKKKRTIRRRVRKISNKEAFSIADKLMGKKPVEKRRIKRISGKQPVVKRKLKRRTK